MKKLFHPLLELIANAAENELAAIIQHLKEENRILRDKLPKRVSLTDEERQRLVKTGSPLGSARSFEPWTNTRKAYVESFTGPRLRHLSEMSLLIREMS